MEWYRRQKRGYNKKNTFSSNGVFGNWGKYQLLKNKKIFPFVSAAAILLTIALAGAVVYLFVGPWYLSVFNLEAKPESHNAPPTPYQEQAPSKPTRDMTGLMQEYLFRLRYIHQPIFSGDEIACTSGQSNGNPRLDQFYVFDINKPPLKSSNENSIEGISLVNDNLFNPQINRKWLAWVDHKNAGGGTIFVMDRRTGEVIPVKNYYGYAPRIVLYEDYLCWSEQMDKNYQCVVLYELKEKKHAVLDTQKDMPFLSGGVDMRGGLVVWSGPDVGAERTDAAHLRGAGIYSFDLNNPSGGVQSFSAGMYAYHPVTNGSVIAWMDTNARPGSGLYIKVGENQPRLIDDNVISYDLGDNFVAYDKDGVIYLYFWADADKAQLTKTRLNTWLVGCFGKRVLWYDLSDDKDVRARNIVKYAEVE